MAEKLIDIESNPVESLLDILLQDKSTKKNIIWATDTYEKYGRGFTDKEQIDRNLLLQHANIIKPRIQKSQEAQAARTRKKAEVFTPAWLCNMMNNYCDQEWFGRKDVFNIENEDHTWTVIEEPIEFPKRKTWKHYVDSRRLEITCGEAPYLVSRYDVSTGELIVPPKRRIGQLDRKLRIVNENTADFDEWLKWTIRAFEATYGYEYQGDNLLIARVNLLLTFIDYYRERWEKEPDEKLLGQVANKIAWNIWQMDGLKDTVPLGKPYEEYHQMSFFDMIPELSDTQSEEPEAVLCKIYNWRRDNSLIFKKLKEI
ncbi:restriction endonuclease subunit M [Blautia massiliensis (ex Durand et al. 2017)]|uniref:restriction endonuclease subunit M n=1 Tax=Blautia massiliensis (ex Durand et al. 2017) TaxID=1737424 RepID=UPI00242BE3A0|nr:restriction endonuclease subunit M [Blautia massiliensis (ex Durand et al. 2017)]MDD6381486.1 restriction endonuclease subunit M [Lachnospiraceae bacterium]MDD6549718.1 restriction endonuclease subunit M [Blautia massiliensis (ex Durand et al. 2017)]